MEKKIKHLEFIQSSISRMSHNSFLLKGWVITIISGFLVFSSNYCLGILISSIINIIFWTLDGFYLWQERLFKGLYNCVRQLSEEEIDFSMNRDKFKKEEKWIDSFFSKTLLIFYGSILVINLIIILII